jgi:hypothetical protein
MLQVKITHRDMRLRQHVQRPAFFSRQDLDAQTRAVAGSAEAVLRQGRQSRIEQLSGNVQAESRRRAGRPQQAWRAIGDQTPVFKHQNPVGKRLDFFCTM